MPDPLDIKIDGTLVTFTVPREYRDKLWADEFGAFQALLRSEPQRLGILRLDFSRCEWADPLPLLATAIELQRFVRLGGRATLVLPSFDNSSPRTRQFLKFLASEGFLGQLATAAAGPDDARYSEDFTRSLAKKTEELAYLNATCVPAVVTQLKPGDHRAAEQFVEELLLRYETTARSYLPAWTRDDLLYRLEIVLKELTSNVAEHGALDGDASWAGIYVRYRHGPAQQVLEQRERWARALRDESAPGNCPLLHGDYWLSRPACIEVFVVDAGPGMIARMRQAGVVLGPHAFRDACDAAFQEGRSTKTNRSTAKGGLHLLSRLLGEASDYLRGLDEGRWIGFAAPLHREKASHDELSDSAPASRRASAPPPLGLAWTIRLSWTTAMDRDEGGWQRWQGEPESHPVLQALTDKRSSAHEYASTWFDDRRWRTIAELEREQRTRSETAEQLDATSYIMWLQPNLTKNDILTVFRRLAERRNNKHWILFIVDIPPREAATYRAALADRPFLDDADPWAVWIDQIVLVTEGWSAVVLSPHRVTRGIAFEVDAQRSSAYVADIVLDSNGESDPDPTSGLHALARCLRYHDSQALWRIFRNERWVGVFLNEKVTWSDGRTLNGYLDFAQSQSIPPVLALYDRALRRVQGLVETTYGGSCRFQPYDRLTDVLAERANARNPTHATTAQVGVGSVIVTGTTARAGRSGSQSKFDVHFFVHPTCSYGAPAYLFLWPREDWLERFPRQPPPSSGYARVGKTAVVAPGGGKYFAVPRYDRDGQSVSYRPPPETYEDWQRGRLPFTKVGHWRYGNHHDLLGLNLDLAIRDSFVRAGSLASFVVTAFATQLQISTRDLSAAGSAWLEQVAQTLVPDAGRRPGLIVYPSHTTTEATVECFLKLLKPIAARKIQPWLIPLRPIRRSSSGSAALVSPLAIERVADQLRTGDLSDEVMLFDDAAISGRTQRELHQILRDAGAARITSVVLVDRLRTPGSATGRDDQEAPRHYWRYDVPTAGSPVSCPMCRALDVADQLQTAVVTVRARERITAWHDEWCAASPVAEWNRGLESIPIALASPDKRFSLKWSADSKQFEARGQVRLRRSIGVAIYATELHTMTARDDVAVTLCQEAGMPPSARMEVMITQLALFRSEYDVDTRVEMLKLALLSAAARKESDMYTSGVVLTALLERPEIVAEALRPIWEDLRARLAQSLGGVPRLNIDLELLSAHLLRHKVDLGVDLPYVRRLLPSTDASPAELLDAFHREGCPDLGTAHISPLWKLGAPAAVWTLDLVTGAIDSASKLTELVTHLLQSRSGRSIPDWPRVQQAHSTMLAALQAVRTALADVASGGSPAESTRFLVTSLLVEMRKMYASEFLGLGVAAVKRGDGEPALETAVEKVVSAISDRDWRDGIAEKVARNQVSPQRWESTTGPKVVVSPSGAGFPPSARPELSVVWNGTVRDCLREILMNVVYSARQIRDPRGDSCDAWIQVTYGDDDAAIRIENAAQQFNGIPSRVPPPRNELDELGVGCTYVNADDRFVVTMTLPYAGTLRSASARVAREATR